jgi:hypothetical protein
MASDWTGNEDFNTLIRKGLEEKEESINFQYPDRSLFHSLFGVFLLRYIKELRAAGVIDNKNITRVEAANIEAITDQFCDKFIEILDHKRPFNW